MPILGLLGSEHFANERFTNIRREVFYTYPNGAAPLTGILSLLKQEKVNDPEFKWYEKRFRTFQTKTTQNNQAPPNGPFLDAAGAVALPDGTTLLTNTLYRVEVIPGGTDQFRVGNVIDIQNVPNQAGTAFYDIKGIITLIDAANNQIQFRPLEQYDAISNDIDANDKDVLDIGSAHQEAAVGSSLAPYNLPVQFFNATQIFRTSFSISGTALKTSAKFDETGPYKDKAKEASLTHLVEIERTQLFGVYSKTVDPNTSLVTYTTRGILGYLRDWEKGTVYGNSPTPITLDSDDQKRIIENAGGQLSEKSYDGYLERVFRFVNNVANEKLVLCGTGFLNVVNQLYKSKSVLNSDLPMADTYGMNVVKHVTPFGTLYYKTHPLFSADSKLRYSALILDVNNMVYTYLDGRDTNLLRNRQPNDADYRKDEWLTDCGLELRFPESHMFIKNVMDYAP
ncbi:MAG: DUF5309 domain-containing protein [Verrucomicrobiae bacterium]|nr:DUF5309 domain-containing protein [Verrucomicrobiae bacterium]